MAILKNISEQSKDFQVLFDRSDYITDYSKTKLSLIGAMGCFPENFPKISRSLKRLSHQENHKMLRHFVVAISPCDEGKLQNTELLKAARKVSGFFKDCYVLYAVHTDTAHTHFHMLVCNTRISDGKQISISDSDLECFKEHCSSVLREYGLRPIEKLDKSDELLEINDELFPKDLSQEERTAILYEGVDKPRYDKQQQYYHSAPVQNCGNTITVNVILPLGTQGTIFQGKNGQPCFSFKPSPYYRQLPYGNIPQNNAVYSGNTVVGYPTPELPSYSPDWYDQDPEWIKEEQSDNSEIDAYGFIQEEADNDDGSFDDCDDYDDDDDGYQEIVQTSHDNKPLSRGASSDIPEEKFDPFVFIEKKNEDKFDPFIFLEKSNK